jgi:hypothetical protein
MLVSAVHELDLGLPEEDQITLLDAAQALVTWWNAAPEGERPAAGSIVAVAGVALGDCLNQYLGMEWSIIHDEDGTDIGMHEPDGTVLMYPTHSVAHRLRDAAASPAGPGPAGANPCDAQALVARAAADPRARFVPRGREAPAGDDREASRRERVRRGAAADRCGRPILSARLLTSHLANPWRFVCYSLAFCCWHSWSWPFGWPIALAKSC